MKRHEFARAHAAGAGFCTSCGAVSADANHATVPQPCAACGVGVAIDGKPASDGVVDIRHALDVGKLELERALCAGCNAQHIHDDDPETAVCTTCGQAAGVVWRATA